MKMENAKCVFVLKVVDFLIANLVIGPLVVFYWRSTWEIMTTYQFPDSPKLSSWVSFITGLVIVMIANLLQFGFTRFALRCSRFQFFLFSRTYTYVLGFGIVNQWRGIWFVLDEYTGTGWLSAMLSLVLPSGLLIVLRSFRNVTAAPAVIATDIFPETHFIIPTRFSQKKVAQRFFLDVVFSVVVAGTLVVAAWRGFWGLLNLYLFPENILKSGYYSLVITYSLACVLGLGNNTFKFISRKLEDVTVLGKMTFDVFVYALCGTTALCHWRGFWLIGDEIHFLSDRILSLWVTHAVAFCVLLLMCASNSVLARGCLKDGALVDGEEVMMDTSYVTSLVAWFTSRPSTEVPEKDVIEQKTELTQIV